jgi:N-acetylglutamate synthase-like GNAT family acetyltransferase
MKILSIRESPEYKDQAIEYFQRSWAEVDPVIYEQAISFSITAQDSLPQWYLLLKENEIIGCAGLITNDFISRGDLYPWLCALFIDEQHRGNAYAVLLMEKIKEDTKSLGFKNLYLCTSLENYYEKYGFQYIGDGRHPWGEDSKIYQIKV